jgi:hypothetical protein
MSQSQPPRLVREIHYEPLPSQLKFHLTEARFKGYSGPVGSGKSQALVQELIKFAHVNPGTVGLLGSPTYTMLRDNTRATLLEVLGENSIPHRFFKSENRIRLLDPQTDILCRSMDQPERLRGLNLAFFGLDELTYTKEETWTRIEGRLRHPKAKQLGGFAVWTPKGFDWVWSRFVSSERKPGSVAVYAKPRENKHVVKLGYYDALEGSYDEKFFRQEVLGEYLNIFGAQVYYTFDRNASVKALAFDPRYPLCWALDFNVDPNCSVIAQVVDVATDEDRRSGREAVEIRVLEELCLHDTRTVEACKVFLERFAKYQAQGAKYVHVYGDASGEQRRTSASTTDWAQVKDALKGAAGVVPHFKYAQANPAVKDRVQEVCSAIRAADGTRRLFVDPACRELIKDFEQLGWKKDAAGTPIGEIAKADKMRSHLSDALGYLVWRERRLHSGWKPDPIL